MFISGAGAFLQTLIFGYAGLRLHVESLKFKTSTFLPPDCKFLYLHRIKYLGSELSFNFTYQSVEIYVNRLNMKHQLVLSSTNQPDTELKGMKKFTKNYILIFFY